MLRFPALLLACFLVVGSVCEVRAINKIWTTATSGNFSDAARWTGGVPGTADSATFDKTGTYTVTFTSSPTNQDLFFQAGTVTFNSSGGTQTYLLNGGGEDAVLTGGSLTLGTSAATALILNVQDDLLIRGSASLLAQFGSDVSSNGLTVGDAVLPGVGDGTLTIDGSGSTLIVKGTSLLGRAGRTGTVTVRNGATADFGGTLGLADSTTALSTGVFNVQSGATVTTADVRIGPISTNGQSGTFNVGDGVGTSTVTQNNNATLVIGGSANVSPSAGRLNVNAGGVFNSGGGTGTVTVNPTGRISVAGTLNLNGNATIDGGLISRSGSGAINLMAGRTFTGQNNADIRLFDAPLSGGTTWQFNSGTIVRNSTKLDVGLAGGTTTVTFDGDQTTHDVGDYNASHVSTLGADGNTANVTVRNGAYVRLNSLHLGASDKAGTTGMLTVTGADSSFDQVNANRTLIVGHAAGGSGTLNVLAGGLYTAGTTTANRNGRINVDGAKFVSLGNFTLDGGRLEVGAAPATGSAFSMDSGRTMTIQNNGQANFASNFVTGTNTTHVTGNGSRLATTNSSASVDVRNGGGLNVTAGGDVAAAGPIHVGSVFIGQVIVDGAGSSLNTTSTSPSRWGSDAAGGEASVTLRNGASASLPGGVHLGSPSTGDSDGVFNIESGAAATLGPLVLNASFADGATGTANVQDTGSTLTVTGLTLGNGVNPAGRGQSGGGSATLNISNGGFFNASGTALKSTGTINIIDGIVNLGVLTDNGGIINFNSGSLSYIGNLMVADDGMLADGDLTLNDNHHLNLSGTVTIDPSSALILDGGTLITGALAANGRFIFNRGQLILNQAGTSINVPVVTNTPSTTIVANANNISLGDVSSFTGFHHLGVLDVGANSVALNSAGYARLGVLTSMNGGTINAPNGIYLAGGADLVGRGNVNARIVGDAGGVIQATGPLTLGNAGSPAGFNFAGELRTRQHTVTLNSGSQSALGNLTTLGSGSSPGTLNAANGFAVDFGEAVSGFGTINSDNTLAKRAIINGTVRGTSAVQPITLTGYVKGVGSFDNVVFAGSFDPGLSPTISTVGSIAFAPTNTLVMELGGTARGSQHDAIVASGNLGLDGALEVPLINGFTPAAGNSFDILDWATLSGTFDTLQLPALAAGLAWDTSQLYATGVLAVVAAGLAGDYNHDGRVDAADYVVWRKNDGSQAGYDTWRTNFGRSTGGAGAAVPEPNSLVLLACLALGTCQLRSRLR